MSNEKFDPYREFADQLNITRSEAKEQIYRIIYGESKDNSLFLNEIIAMNMRRCFRLTEIWWELPSINKTAEWKLLTQDREQSLKVLFDVIWKFLPKPERLNPQHPSNIGEEGLGQLLEEARVLAYEQPVEENIFVIRNLMIPIMVVCGTGERFTNVIQSHQD